MSTNSVILHKVLVCCKYFFTFYSTVINCSQGLGLSSLFDKFQFENSICAPAVRIIYLPPECKHFMNLPYSRHLISCNYFYWIRNSNRVKNLKFHESAIHDWVVSSVLMFTCSTSLFWILKLVSTFKVSWVGCELTFLMSV